MSNLTIKSHFKLSTLALSVGLSLMTSGAFALEALDDQGLAASTGEGVALLPEDFRMVFQGPRTHDYTATPVNLDYTDRTKDTGYIRVIPVGPLTTEAVTAGAQKADIFLYGLAISRADADINNRYNSSATGKIKSWGSANNPWLLKVQSATVPNFAGASTANNLSYLSFETPEYNIAGFSDASQDDYHLKLGFWADLFMRDPKIAAPDANPDGWGAGLSNRLRLQAIWNDFSINGSSINLFQTLGGATNSGGLSTSYNNTLGLSGTLRFNSGNSDSSVLRATISADNASRTYSPARTGTGDPKDDPATSWNAVTTPTAPPGGCDNNFTDLNCQYRFRNRTVTDTQTNVKWSLDPTLAAKALRFSTRGAAEENATQTPAINRTAAPAFDASEGLFMYGANINLTLGSLYQPLVIGVADDGRNINMEVTRIANQPSVYQKIYTDYADPLSTTYVGSTCNVNQCGRTVGGVFYPATHSSISIGSTTYDNTGSKNRLSAYQQADAIGVSFGALPASYNQVGTFTQAYNDVQYQQRQGITADYVVTDRYRLTAVGTTRQDPYNSPLGSFDGPGLNNYAFRWYNVLSDHTFWGYATGLDANGNPILSDTAGRNAIAGTFTINGVTYNDNCATDYACLGGVAMPGAGGYKGQDGKWVSGGTGTYGGTYSYAAGGQNAALANMMAAMRATFPGFKAGTEDCPSGTTGENDCTGRTGGSGATVGVSLLNGDERTPTTAANANWTNAGRNPAWLNAANNATAIAVYDASGTPKFKAVPTQITAVNPSPLNNLGSASIDGLLIQHMKLTTKGL